MSIFLIFHRSTESKHDDTYFTPSKIQSYFWGSNLASLISANKVKLLRADLDPRSQRGL